MPRGHATPSGSRRHSRTRRSKPALRPDLRFGPFPIVAALFVVCALGGGSSRIDSLSLLYLRPMAVAALVALLFLSRQADLRSVRVPLTLLTVLAGWMAVQLIPLPPAVWSALPFRATILHGLQAIGVEAGWRPVSLTPDLTLNSLIALVVPAALLIGSASLSARQQIWLSVIVVAAAAVSILVEVAQVAGGPDSPFYLYAVSNVGTPSGLFANRNHQAAFLACVLPLLAVTAHPRLSGRHALPLAWGYLGFALMAVIAVVATGSRTGLLIAAVLLIYTLFTSISYVIPNPKHRRAITAAAALGVIALLIGMVLLGRATSFDRLTGFDATSEQRLKALPTLFQMFEQFILTGTGFGSFDPVFRIMEPDSLLHATFFNHAHNDWLELAITGGLPALVVLALFCVWVIRNTITRFRQRSSPMTILARAGGLIVLALGTASLTDYPLRTPLLSALLALAVGWLSRSPDQEDSSKGNVANAHLSA
jgi:O-antigen ligase